MADARTTTLTGWARIADYLFGRNALIGLASLMLLLISGYATWHGMRDFIVGVSTSGKSAGQELPGGLSVSNDVLVIAVVIALTFLMWLALREQLGAIRPVDQKADGDDGVERDDRGHHQRCDLSADSLEIEEAEQLHGQ